MRERPSTLNFGRSALSCVHRGVQKLTLLCGYFRRFGFWWVHNRPRASPWQVAGLVSKARSWQGPKQLKNDSTRLETARAQTWGGTRQEPEVLSTVRGARKLFASSATTRPKARNRPENIGLRSCMMHGWQRKRGGSRGREVVFRGWGWYRYELIYGWQ